MWTSRFHRTLHGEVMGHVSLNGRGLSLYEIELMGVDERGSVYPYTTIYAAAKPRVPCT